ncbi:MerR family transcriptional regulator [Clostridium folliculivorans]|uniref:MerR family transcriptional regulator n=1 Tax=Clostridium folliculivorans TaxID=2886038 RepID=A0A9W5Y6C5_9CLOT|nr:MerR family transcriptional regulator [Clostridium folliculivorans]GKU27308.1 MerR family transcriptional regulator [Clostridium folliculivorans]GKU32159.1 MerR family transcriptional regulator [Clostridium folliculivorans]
MGYSIKEVSEKLNISQYTLRYYEKEGLIPYLQRNYSGRRVYSDNDLIWIQLIGCMRATGMSIAYIKNYVELTVQGKGTLLKRREIILEQKEIIEAEIRKYSDLLAVVNIKLQCYYQLIEDDFEENSSE